jgi:hypothetical protein
MSIQNIGVGISANDGTGDSIRDAFLKTNNNFAYLSSALNNVSTGNLIVVGNATIGGTTANVTIVSGSPSYWTGEILLNGSQIATVASGSFAGGVVARGTYYTDTTDPTSAYTNASATQPGAVQVSGGLSVGKTIWAGNINAYGITATGTLISLGTFSAPSGSFLGALAVGSLSVGAGSWAGDLDIGLHTVTGSTGSFTYLNGTLQTASSSQPNITSLGTLTQLAVTGSVTAANIIATWGNIWGGNLNLSTLANVGSLHVGQTGVIIGNLTAANISTGVGTFGNLTVRTYPSIYHVPNKGYVNITALAFAIGLGS